MIPLDLLAEIMFADWPGLRLATTCRALNEILAARKSETASRFVREQVHKYVECVWGISYLARES